MSQAKPLTGAEVKGYRTLTDAEITQMNQFKHLSAQFIEALTTAADPRWLAIAKTDMQTACMAACRAVSKPDSNS